MAQVEGTADDGEANVETSNFYKWMISARAKPKFINKVVNAGIDSMDMLEEIANDPSILNDTDDLNKIEKAKLRTIVKKLPIVNQHTIIDKEETEAMIQMENKLKSLKNATNLFDNSKHNIDELVINHTKSIQSTFKQMHKILNNRETALIKKLNEIANEKKNKLNDTLKILNQQTTSSEKQIRDCHRKLKKPIQLTELEQRKKEILRIANNIKNIKLLTENDAVIANKINVCINPKIMIRRINEFGNVSSGFIPVLLSLIADKNCSIGIKWKLDGNEECKMDGNRKLKVEWTDVDSKYDNENERKQEKEWKYNQEVSLQNNKWDVFDVTVKNMKAVYLFRMKYFDGELWSSYSNIKSIPYTCTTIIDKWKSAACSPLITINGDTVTKNKGGDHKSVYLTQVVSQGIHIWRLKINRIGAHHWNPFGIWKTNSGQPIINTYWTSKANNGYAYVLSYGFQIIPGSPGNGGPKYGVKCATGDTITMTLDFKTLSYVVNGTNYGKAFDIEHTAYTGALSCNNENDSYTLLSYNVKQ